MYIVKSSVEIQEVNSHVTIFNVNGFLRGKFLTSGCGSLCPSCNGVVVVLEGDYTYGKFPSIQAAADAMSGLYAEIISNQLRYCIKQLKTCIKLHGIKTVGLKDFITH